MNSYRLPENIQPIKYRIIIEPINPQYEYFKGKCYIIFSSNGKSNFITLNSLELEIKSVYLVDNNKEYTFHNKEYDNDRHQLKLNFDEVPTIGMLIIEYFGKIYDESMGFFKVKQKNEWIFYTHFEPICARRCFPCFDEPNFKAKFNMELIVPYNKLVLFNTDIKKKIDLGGKMLYVFKETLPISTFILAFYVGNSKKSEGQTNDGIIVRIFSNNSKKYREFLLENAIRCMDKLSSLLEIKYPLSKIDIMYIPKLEAAGMENWGLIFATDGGTDSPEDADFQINIFSKIDIITTLFHELAHQWFGNIVTMKWWNDIWLSESFSTWFSWYIIKQFYPEWNNNERYYIYETLEAEETDYLIHSHAIDNFVEKPYEITTIFDSISYAKGSTLINMLVDYIGIDNFMNGIRTYLKNFYLRNATTENFISCMEKVNKKPVRDFLLQWTQQKNFPIVNVALQNNSMMLIKQEPFTILPAGRLQTQGLTQPGLGLASEENLNKLWTIPLTKNIMMIDKILKIPIEKLDSKLNKDANGLYLVNYEPDLFRTMLLNNFSKFSNLDIAQMLHDLFLFFKSGRISIDNYFDFFSIIIKNIQNRTNGILIHILLKQYFYVKTTSCGQNNQKILINYNSILANYVENILDRLGLFFENDNNIDIIMTKKYSLELACLIGIEKYVNFCLETFKKFKEKYVNGQDALSELNVHIENIIIKYALIYGDENIFEFILTLLDDDKYFGLVISNITWVRDPDLYVKSLELILMDDLSVEDKLNLIKLAGLNFLNNKYLWEFIKKNWDKIFKSLDKTQFSLPRMIKALKLITDDDNTIISDMKTFFADKNTEKFEKNLQIILECIAINTKFSKMFK